MKDGKLIPIWDEFEKMLKETQKLDLQKLNSNEPIEIQTHVIVAENMGEEFKKEEIVTLRIRTENGNWNLILKMRTTDKISKVYEYVKDYKEESNFEIRSTFPWMTLHKSESKSLGELGFWPNAVLIMHKI